MLKCERLGPLIAMGDGSFNDDGKSRRDIQGGSLMKELNVIDLSDGLRRTVVCLCPLRSSGDRHRGGPELTDYMIEKNSLKEIARMTVGPKDLANRLIGAEQANPDGTFQAEFQRRLPKFEIFLNPFRLGSPSAST
jgi:hypothetical protein